MAATIQILVAGALLLAWIWVLGRPLLLGLFGRSGFDERRAPLGPASYEPMSPSAPPIGVSAERLMMRSWRDRPAVIRRRQLMLATMFAVFASFLMAVALRGLFVALFVLMLITLIVHLGIASYRGGQLVAEQHARQVAKAKKRVEAPPMAIRAPQVAVGLTGGDDGPTPLTISADEQLGDGIGVTSFVSELIDLEWGDAANDGGAGVDPLGPDQADEPHETAQREPITMDVEAAGADGEPTTAPAAAEAESSAGAAEGSVAEANDLERVDEPDGVDETRPRGDAGPEAGAGVAGTGDEADDGNNDDDETTTGGEAIFTRAAKDLRSRSRRSATPIYIESQLDDDIVDGPKAVNHP